MTYTHDGDSTLQGNTEKQHIFRTLYGIDYSLFVHLDARRPGVVVPGRYKQSYQLVLQFGSDLPVPIENLTIGKDKLGATLTFDQKPFHCVIPWPAVFFMVGETHRDRGFAWPRDCPGELLHKVHDRDMEEARRKGIVKDRDGPEAKAARKRAIFTVLDGSKTDTEKESPSKKEAPTLRLVETEENGGG